MTKQLTLCLIRHEGRILLGMKKQGFGEGLWNGFGGKVVTPESIEDAARRELLEEAGLTASALSKVGVLNFEFLGNEDVLEVHVFGVEEWEGEPVESDEMSPEWFAIDAIPFDDMWADDRHWFPLFLAGKKFTGRFVFDAENAIVEHELREVEVV